jgi:hypothetical protein
MIRSAFAISPALTGGIQAGGWVRSPLAPTGGAPSMERITRAHCGDDRREKRQTGHEKWQTRGKGSLGVTFPTSFRIGLPPWVLLIPDP